MSQPYLNFIHLLSMACWIGSIVFFSFFVAPAVFKTLDKEKAGELVGVIFPKYYLVGYVCAVTALLTLFFSHPPILQLVFKTVVLGIMTGAVFYAGLGVRPKAARLKARIKSAEKPEEREPLEAEFKTLHSLSVKLNAGALIAGLAYLWLTAAGLTL